MIDDQNTQNQTNNPNDASALREKLQQDIVSIITRKLESGEMTEERAKLIAKMTLEKLPEDISYKKLMEVLPSLDDDFEELKTAIIPIITDYQSKIAQHVQMQISGLLKQQKYEAAMKLAQKAIEFESSLG
ncbi:hypothetical protein KBD45_03875 [Candidatus Dojkabacteria bacterium]|nr:hypothetical protein [Candidatus Dojkabacteria bacterium]